MKTKKHIDQFFIKTLHKQASRQPAPDRDLFDAAWIRFEEAKIGEAETHLSKSDPASMAKSEGYPTRRSYSAAAAILLVVIAASMAMTPAAQGVAHIANSLRDIFVVEKSGDQFHIASRSQPVSDLVHASFDNEAVTTENHRQMEELLGFSLIAFPERIGGLYWTRGKPTVSIRANLISKEDLRTDRALFDKAITDQAAFQVLSEQYDVYRTVAATYSDGSGKVIQVEISKRPTALQESSIHQQETWEKAAGTERNMEYTVTASADYNEKYDGRTGEKDVARKPKGIRFDHWVRWEAEGAFYTVHTLGSSVPISKKELKDFIHSLLAPRTP